MFSTDEDLADIAHCSDSKFSVSFGSWASNALALNWHLLAIHLLACAHKYVVSQSGKAVFLRRADRAQDSRCLLGSDAQQIRVHRKQKSKMSKSGSRRQLKVLMDDMRICERHV